MSTHVEGFRPPDEKWRKMKQVYDACQAAQLPIPEAVEQFFEHDRPDEAGVSVRLQDTDCCEDYSDGESSEGFQIDIRKLPKDVVFIRFTNSY